MPAGVRFRERARARLRRADDDAAVPPAGASTEGYIPPQTRKKKVDYGAFSASMTRGAADEFDDYD